MELEQYKQKSKELAESNERLVESNERLVDEFEHLKEIAQFQNQLLNRLPMRIMRKLIRK